MSEDSQSKFLNIYASKSANGDHAAQDARYLDNWLRTHTRNVCKRRILSVLLWHLCTEPFPWVKAINHVATEVFGVSLWLDN